jgi:hypothetical protein
VKAQPYICLVCKHRGHYYGRLVFPDELPPTDEQINAVADAGGSLAIPEPPKCPNHKKGYEHDLVPARTAS